MAFSDSEILKPSLGESIFILYVYSGMHASYNNIIRVRRSTASSLRANVQKVAWLDEEEKIYCPDSNSCICFHILSSLYPVEQQDGPSGTTSLLSPIYIYVDMVQMGIICTALLSVFVQHTLNFTGIEKHFRFHDFFMKIIQAQSSSKQYFPTHEY